MKVHLHDTQRTWSSRRPVLVHSLLHGALMGTAAVLVQTCIHPLPPLAQPRHRHTATGTASTRKSTATDSKPGKPHPRNAFPLPGDPRNWNGLGT